jgi:hypothetical protein
MQFTNRYHRFDPITIRAAARLVHMGRTGRLSEWEVRYYIRELTAMVPQAAPRASRALRRLAERRAALGHTGVPPSSRRRSQPPVEAGSLGVEVALVPADAQRGVRP